jgi:hypothetical protein
MVLIGNDESLETLTMNFSELLLIDNSHISVNLLTIVTLLRLHGSLACRIRALQGEFDVTCPQILRITDLNLARDLRISNGAQHLVLVVGFLLRLVLLELEEEDFLHSLLHGVEQFRHPVLDFGVDFNSLEQVKLLAVSCLDQFDLDILASAFGLGRHDNSINTFKDFLDVDLELLWLLGLTNHLEKIRVREEEESGEVLPLGHQELAQLLLNILESSLQLTEQLIEAGNEECRKSIAITVDTRHLIFEDLVLLSEDCIFGRHLLLDIWLTLEDLLEVLPELLNCHQSLESISDACDVRLPHVNVFLELSVVRTTLVGAQITAVVLNQLHDVTGVVDEVVGALVGARNT